MSKHAMNTPSINDAVMSRIKSGDVTMRPQSYFLLLTSLGVATVVASSFVLAYVTSIVYFSLRIMTAETMAYGARSRLAEMLQSFPWWLLLVALLLGWLTVVLVRHMGRMYQYSARVIAMCILLISLFIGVLFTSLNIGNQAHQLSPAPGKQHNQRHVQQ